MVKVNKFIKLRNKLFSISIHQKPTKSFTNSVARRIQRFEFLLTIRRANLRLTKTYFFLRINRMNANRSKRLNLYKSLLYAPLTSLRIQPSFRTAIVIFFKVHIIIIPITAPRYGFAPNTFAPLYAIRIGRNVYAVLLKSCANV